MNSLTEAHGSKPAAVQLVTQEELEKLIDTRKELEPHRDYLKQRWMKMVLWWDGRSSDARKKYMRIRGTIVVGGILLPVLSTLAVATNVAPFAGIAISCVGAVVAVCAAWEGIANYGEVWADKRRASELIKVEGWQFFELAGKYKSYNSHNEAYERFVSEVEDMIAREVGEYFAVFTPSLQRSADDAEQITAEIMTAVKGKLHSLNGKAAGQEL